MRWAAPCLLGLLTACGKAPWNDPYPARAAAANVLYAAFSARPKHLDPARSYSADESAFIAQIYEPPLQYAYLKRPYTLEPLTATRVPRPRYYDARGQRLPDDAPADQVAYSVYWIHIKPGIYYQPHPAFARDARGHYRYDHLTAQALSRIHGLADFRHTGTRELVAADYVYEVKRLADPRLHSPIFGLMSHYIVGFKRYAAALQRAEREAKAAGHAHAFLDLARYPLRGAQVVDRYTYSITLRGKYPQFLYWLAMPFFAPVPPEVDRFYAQPGLEAKNITLDWYPVGTGPYVLAVNDPNRRMVLARNPHFHHETYPVHGMPGDRAAGLLRDAGRPLPFIDKAVFSLEKENIPYWNKFLQGYYDSSGISSDSFDQAIRFGGGGEARLSRAMRERGIRLATSVSPSNWYLGFNMLDPVVGGGSRRARLLRRAISIAVNYEQYISIFLNGRGIPAQGPIPPGIFGYVPGCAGIDAYVYTCVDGKPRRLSIETARRLLAEAGYPGGRDAKTGRPLLLYFDTMGGGPDDKARLDWLRKQFRKLDIQLVIRDTDYNRFQDKMSKGNTQIFEWGWNADYPDPENFLFLLYGPNGKVKHGGENAANYHNPEFDRLFARMQDMADGPARRAVIERMVAVAQRDSPWVWGFYPKQFRLYHSWLYNVKPNPMANNTLKYLRLDPQRRAAYRARWNRPVLWPLVALAALLALVIVPALAAYRRRERAALKLANGKTDS
ncbi:MAG: ABC transporter substrate-binding protein [Gammaproteobacteria bacterium]|nr:ABC transporter substrate-binding protein [Gammaproteobacteria bacterium]